MGSQGIETDLVTLWRPRIMMNRRIQKRYYDLLQDSPIRNISAYIAATNPLFPYYDLRYISIDVMESLREMTLEAITDTGYQLCRNFDGKDAQNKMHTSRSLCILFRLHFTLSPNIILQGEDLRMNGIHVSIAMGHEKAYITEYQTRMKIKAIQDRPFNVEITGVQVPTLILC